MGNSAGYDAGMTLAAGVLSGTYNPMKRLLSIPFGADEEHYVLELTVSAVDVKPVDADELITVQLTRVYTHAAHFMGFALQRVWDHAYAAQGGSWALNYGQNDITFWGSEAEAREYAKKEAFIVLN